MGNCNCKGGRKQIINHLNSPDHIAYAKEVYNRIVTGEPDQVFTDIDKVEIIGAYATLYPSSSQTPDVSEAIKQIKQGIELFDVQYKRR
jgi:hypothetical protein